MAFQKIWRALFSCNHRFEIPRLAVLATNTCKSIYHKAKYKMENSIPSIDSRKESFDVINSTTKRLTWNIVKHLCWSVFAKQNSHHKCLATF